MFLNLEFDQSAASAPQSFLDTIRTAAQIIGQTFADAITVNLSVGYGELTFGGTVDPLDNGAAEAGAVGYGIYNYSTVRNLLTQTVDPEAASGVAALPAGNSFQGYTSVVVWSAEQKALGLAPADATALDGAVGFATDINPDLLLGVALHELTHAMGRIASADSAPPDVFDLYRFTSPGLRLVGDNLPSPAAYFSLDNGVTRLADYGRQSDNSDYFNGTLTPNDAFNEFYAAGTLQRFSQVDLLQMQALGFHLARTVTAPEAPPETPETPAIPGRLVWQSAVDGAMSVWTLHDTSASGAALPSAAGWQAQDLGNFGGDGSNTDILFRNAANGHVTIWLDHNGTMSGFNAGAATLDWNIMAAADFNGDGKSDILWRNEQNGYVSVWQMDGTQATGSYNPGQVGLNWHIVGAADYTGDGRADILWRNASSGEVNLWQLDSQGQAHGSTIATLSLDWQAAGSGDFNGDGKADILWRNANTGQAVIWEMNGSQVQAWQAIGQPGPQWKIAAVTDANDDGKSDIIWQDSNTGQVVAWAMNGFAVDHTGVLATVDHNWQAVNHHYDWI